MTAHPRAMYGLIGKTGVAGQRDALASLTLPSVQAARAKGRSLIAGFSNRVETVPIGGHGLQRREAR